MPNVFAIYRRDLHKFETTTMFCGCVRCTPQLELHKARLKMKIEKSIGRTKSGAQVYYLRPDGECINRSYRITCIDEDEYKAKVSKIEKKIKPEIQWLIDGYKVIANNSNQALREYWRVCDKSKIGKDFEVINLEYLKKY